MSAKIAAGAPQVHLALVTETFPPEINGVAMTLHRLVTGLAARGHAVQVIRPRQSRADQPCLEPFTELLVPGLPLPGYPELKIGLPVYFTLFHRWSTVRPDLVHVPTEGPLGFAAVCAARALGLPVTSSFHTNFHAYSKHYGLGFVRRAGFAYLRHFHNLTRCTFAPSPDVVATLAAAGLNNLRLLGRGVDTVLFHPAKRDNTLRASWGAAPETPVALYVGRLAPEKNLALVAETWAALRPVLPGLRLVLVGDGPSRRDLAARYPEIHYAGVQRGEDLARHYASGDLFLFASVTETFGNVVTEALASGLVVTAFDYAAARAHLCDGENGFLAAYDDPSAFHAAAARAAEARARWPALRAAARTTALTLSWDRIIRTFEDTVAELLPTPLLRPGKFCERQTLPL
jgi:glycosyltransferase involved in cell wall biosynthesis